MMGGRGVTSLRKKIQLINIDEVRETGNHHSNTSLMTVTGKIHHEI